MSPGATVVGAVTFGPQVGIWFGAAIRADLDSVEIGGRSNVQDNCVFHTGDALDVTLGEGVSVGHGAVLHGFRDAQTLRAFAAGEKGPRS